MLIDTWYGKSSKIKAKIVKPPLFSAEFAGHILAHLLINDYLKEDFHFTPYSTISYLKKGNLFGWIFQRIVTFIAVTINFDFRFRF